MENKRNKNLKDDVITLDVSTLLSVLKIIMLVFDVISIESVIIIEKKFIIVGSIKYGLERRHFLARNF